MAIWDWFKSEDQKKADRAKEVERQQKQRLSDVLRQSMATGNPAQKRAAQTYRTNSQRQAAQTIKKPTQSIWDKTTDIFDANSAMDRYKRLQTNQRELYQDQQRAKGVADSSIETNPLSRGLLTAQKMAEGVIEAPVAFGRSTGSYLGMKSGDYNSALKAEDTNRDVITSKNVEMLRLLNDPTVDTATKQRAINFLNNSDGYTSGMDEIRAKIASDTDPRRMAAAGVSLAADLATLGVAGASKAGIKGAYTAAKAGSTAGRLGQVTTGLVAGAKRFGIDTAKTAGLGSIAGGTSAYIQDPNATFKQAVMGAGMGAAGGAALPTAMIGVSSVPATTRLIGRGATKAVKAIDNLGKPTGEALAKLNAEEQIIKKAITDKLKMRSMAQTNKPDYVPIIDKEIDALEKQIQAINARKSGQGGFVANPFYKDPVDALKAEARQYKSADEFANAFEKRYHQTSPEVADLINKEGFRLDKRASGDNDILPVGVNTKRTDKTIRLPKEGSQIETYFNKDANIKSFQNRNQAEQYFYGHPEGAKYRNAVDASKQLDIDYQKQVDSIGAQMEERYREIWGKKKVKDDPQYQALNKKEEEIINKWGEDVNRQAKIAQAESTRIAKKEGWDALDIAQDTGGFGSVTDNTIVLDPSKLRTKQQLTDLYNQATKPSLKQAMKSQKGSSFPGGPNPVSVAKDLADTAKGKKLDALKAEARDIQATIESPYLNTLPPAQAQSKLAGYRRRLAEINKQLNANNTALNGNEPKINKVERKITETEPKLNQVEPKSTETIYKITARNQAGVTKQLRELSKKADSDGNTVLGEKLYKLADDVMYDRQYEYFGNKGYKHKLDKLVKTYKEQPKSAPVEKTPTLQDALEGKNTKIKRTKNTGGTLRPDKEPQPYKNNVISRDTDKEYAKMVDDKFTAKDKEVKEMMRQLKEMENKPDSKYAKAFDDKPKTAKKPKKMSQQEFKDEAMRIRDNLKTGETGYIEDAGKTYEISRDSARAKLVTKPKVAPKTVRKAVPQVSEEMALTKTAEQPPTKPPKPPTGNQEIPALGTGKMKKSKFASKTVPESEYVSEPIRKATKENAPLYAQENEKVRFNQSLTKYEKMGRDKFGSDVADRLDVKKGSITSQDVVDAEVLAAKLDAEGKYVEASDIYTKLSGHLTKAGQTVQAAAIMARRSPQGARRHAQKAIEKSGVKFSKGMAKDLNQLTKELASAKTDHDRQFALFLIGEFVKKNTPTSKADRLVNVWRAGLLTSPVTTAGNLMANTGETAIRKGFVNPTATLADALMGKFTGKRTMALAPSGAGTKGFTRGAKTLPAYMKTGFQESDALSKAKYENSGNIHYGDGKLGKALGTYVNGTYRLMGVADAPYRYAGMDEALGSMAKAEALNKGLKGKAQKEFIEQFTKNPPKDALERATKEGYYASFQNDTLLNDMAQGLKQKLERSSRGGPAAKAVSDFVMPFVRTPSAIATRLVERTPVGIAKEMTSQILKVRKGQPFDQRAMSQAIGNGTFGAVVIGAGMTLAQQDLLTFGYPTEQKERDLWEMEGKQPYSVKVGNRWYSMNYLQPFGTLLAIGGQAKKDMDSGASGGEAATKAVATAAQSIQDQSFLKGISGILDMIGDPERSARRYMEQTASSIVPNFVRAGARASDDVQRKPTTVGESVASAIPGLRQTTPVKFDALGRPIPAKDNFLNQYVNPLRPSKVRDDIIAQELRKLKDNDLATMPTDINKSTYGDQQLSKAQTNQATQYTNKRVSDEWAKVVKTKEYQSLTDGQKKKTLDAIKRDYHAVAKAEWAAKNNLINDQYEPKLSAKQKQIAMGEAPDYVYGGLPKNLSKTAKDILINSDGKDAQWKNAKSNSKEVQDTIQSWVGDKYQLPKVTNYVAEQWAKYEQARADGTLNPIEAETKKKSILKTAFKSEFDDTTRSFYSLGDDAMRNELRKGTISKEQMDKVIAIDNALTELGLQKYAQVGKTLRRELGYGLVSSSSGSGKSGSSRSGRSGRSRSLGMDYKLFGFGNPQSTTGALRKLLEQTQA